MSQIQQLREKAVQYGLVALTDTELCKFMGYKGEPSEFDNHPLAKAAREYSRRYHLKEKDYKLFRTSRDSYEYLSFLSDYSIEHFWVIFLNSASRFIIAQEMSKGGIAGTVVDLRVILSIALKYNSTRIILAHNHPSGSLQPSNADKNLTEKVKNACTIMEIELLDHIIISNTGYLSFADEGLL